MLNSWRDAGLSFITNHCDNFGSLIMPEMYSTSATD
jgi:hypothetical protein